MNKEGKLFGRINIIDLGIILIILIAVTGLFLVKTGRHSTSANVIKKESMIEFDVVIRGLKLSSEEKIFKPKDKTFITIRNVPYTSLEIVKSEMTPWQTIIPDPKNPSRAVAVTDPTAPHTYNFFVTLKDKALITADGAVIGGNKIKTGLPVTLEGYKYRLNGIVSDVRNIE
jgi:hypothetical protein